MHKNKWNLTLAFGLLLGVILACSASTANIGSLKVTSDEAGKNEAKSFNRTRRTHVGQLLFADDVDVEIVVAAVLADDHALVHIDACSNEKDTAILQAMQRIRRGQAN